MGWVDPQGKIHIRFMHRTAKGVDGSPGTLFEGQFHTSSEGSVLYNSTWFPSSPEAMDAGRSSPNMLHGRLRRDPTFAMADMIRYGPFRILRALLQVMDRLASQQKSSGVPGAPLSSCSKMMDGSGPAGRKRDRRMGDGSGGGARKIQNY